MNTDVLIRKCRICNTELHRSGRQGPLKICGSRNCLRASQGRDWQSKSRPCMVCGTPFMRRDRGVAAWTCSDECKVSRTKERRIDYNIKAKERTWARAGGDPRQKSCVLCGAEFGGVAAPLHDRCDKCRLSAKTHICVKCGNEFVRGKTSKDSLKYCSRECYMRDRFGPSKPKKELTEKTCRVCGVRLSPSSSALSCSKSCQRKYKRKQHTERMAQRRWTCQQCGLTWLGRKANVCQECRTIASRETMRAQRTRSKAAKRGARLQTFGRKITLRRLIERDGIRCGICGRNTNIRAHYLSDDYPSVDHIVPVSHGGAHSWTNVRVAHRGCNSVRSDKPSGAIQTALPMVIEIRGAHGTIVMTPVATEERKRR